MAPECPAVLLQVHTLVTWLRSVSDQELKSFYKSAFVACCVQRSVFTAVCQAEILTESHNHVCNHSCEDLRKLFLQAIRK